MEKFAQQVCNSLLGPAEVDVHLILKESVVALYAGDRAIGSASSRHRLICKIGNGRLKVIVEFSRALERGRWERRETAEGGKAGRQKDLNSQDGGLVASRPIVTSLKTSALR